MYYSCSLLKHYFHLLSLIAQSVILPRAIRVAQQNFIISMPIPAIFTNTAMTLLWMRNKGIKLVGKGQLGAVAVVQAWWVECGPRNMTHIYHLHHCLLSVYHCVPDPRAKVWCCPYQLNVSVSRPIEEVLTQPVIQLQGDAVSRTERCRGSLMNTGMSGT